MLDNIQELEIEKEKLEEALTYSDWSYDERELITKGIYWLNSFRSSLFNTS